MYIVQLIISKFPPYLPTFRSYLDLIDLTKDSDSSSSENNEDDDSILPEISLTTSSDRSGYVVTV